MKKRFFKRLSLVLALAMVLSVVSPAAGALAKQGPSLNSVKKYLHLGREETDANWFNFNINNKKSGWKYEWKSADESVATVKKTNGVTTAVGVGRTKVTVYITDKDGKKVTNLTAEVIVRDNIEEVTINNPIETLAVGERHNFNRDFVTEAGRTDKTSAITRWTIDPAEGVELNPNNGVVVPEKAGEYTVTAWSFQSKARYNKWLKDPVKYEDQVLDTDTCTFVVGNEITDVKQVDKNSFKVYFASEVDKDEVAKMEVSRLIGDTDTKIKEVIKEAKVDEKDTTVVNVELYVDFATDTTYVIDYPEMDSAYLRTATYNKEDVVDLEIEPATVVEGKATKVEVKLYNANDVNITTDELLAYVTIDVESDKAWYNSSTKELTIFEKGDFAKVKATYHTYEYDPNTGNELGAIPRERIIYAVDEPVVAVGSIAAWTLAEKDPNFDDANHRLAAEDSKMKVFVKSSLTNSDDFKYSETDPKFTFKSSDESILIVTPDGELYPIKEGAAVIVVSYDGNVIGALNVNIGAKRNATTLKLDSNRISLSNSAAVNDQVTVKIELKDQYGADVKIDPSNSEIKLNNANLEVGTLITEDTISSNELKFYGLGVPANTYTFTVKVNGLTTILVVNVQKPKDEKTSYYRIDLSETSYDIALSSDKTEVAAKFSVVGYASNGVANEVIAVSGSAASGNAFEVEVTKDGKKFDNWTTDADENVIINLANLVSGGKAKKVETGTYRVELLEKLEGGVIRKHHIVYFDVKDNQASPTITIDKLVTDAVGLEAALKDALTVKLDGNELEIVEHDTIGDEATGTVYVKTVTVREAIGDSYIEHILDVKKTISFKN